MNLYRFYFTAEHGAEHTAEIYAHDWDHARELFREDFGSLKVDYIDLIDEDDGEIASVDAGEYDDSMDGDAESALASAGFGTDEDYGYYGEE
jgi:hypothetical protein